MPASVLSRTDAAIEAHIRQFAGDVRRDLSKPQKELHSKYLYDDLGSALFEAITHLPEYGLTRADERLLCSHADEIAARTPSPAVVVELGSGVGRKTRSVLAALQPLNPGLRYYPIDVSSDALTLCARDLSEFAEVRPLEQSYLDGMDTAVAERQGDEALLLLFLGSTIGNFEPRCALEFLRSLRRVLRSGDALLIGADLVKEPARMLLAYDDPAGVTAAFNLNLLGRINRELGANFNLRNFVHEARYDESHHRIEMHLRSLLDQTVSIPAADLTVHFQEHETIWTESSHKFRVSDMFEMAEQTGFQVATQWVDPAWPFVESLWAVR